MSNPISVCTIRRAARGDEAAYKHYISDMTINLSWGAYTIFPCMCKPECDEPNEEQVKAFNERVTKHFKENPPDKERVCMSDSFDETYAERIEAAQAPDEAELNDGLDI